MPTKLEQRWPEIKRSSRSDDEFHRTASLATAVGCLEVALAASGIEAGHREGLQQRLRRSGFASKYKDAPDATSLKAAIEARNSAVHQHAVPKPDACHRHVSTVHKAWRALRRTFVTKHSAVALATTILEGKVVSTVFLFGSLARGSRDPKDIDLLLFDDGEYSSWASQYSGPDEWVLEQAFVATPATQAATRCGWLDYIMVDGTRFGSDKGYTLSLAQSQPDPLFFVNLSANLLEFDPRAAKWKPERPQIFQRLAGIRTQLETENILPPADDRVRRRKGPRRR